MDAYDEISIDTGSGGEEHLADEVICREAVLHQLVRGNEAGALRRQEHGGGGEAHLSAV